MNKRIGIIFLIVLFFLTDAMVSYTKKKEMTKEIKDDSIRAIYVSYLEYLSNFCGNSMTVNKSKINKMIDAIYEKKYNAILLHVSPFSDSIYNSKIFPYSYTLTGVEGKNPGFDYLEYFIKIAHAKNIKIHAWINPYRISFNNDIKSVSNKNPAYKLMNTSSIYIDKKGIYYNPASNIVKSLIVDQVKEIINNYNVDGIHFDDYFYIQDKIDQLEYKKYQEKGGTGSLKEFRLNNTNDLIKRVYQVIKEKDNRIIFSIAPDGNINNNYLYHFADIKTWLKNDNYIDIIMPQIYYGFNNEYSPFEKVLRDWLNLIKNKNIKIIPVLAFYKVGEEDLMAGKGKNEWLEDKNIINKQINILKQHNIEGFAAFRYDYIVKNS